MGRWMNFNSSAFTISRGYKLFNPVQHMMTSPITERTKWYWIIWWLLCVCSIMHFTLVYIWYSIGYTWFNATWFFLIESSQIHVIPHFIVLSWLPCILPKLHAIIFKQVVYGRPSVKYIVYHPFNTNYIHPVKIYIVTVIIMMFSNNIHHNRNSMVLYLNKGTWDMYV